MISKEYFISTRITVFKYRNSKNILVKTINVQYQTRFKCFKEKNVDSELLFYNMNVIKS